jgi:hypothetical protein
VTITVALPGFVTVKRQLDRTRNADLVIVLAPAPARPPVRTPTRPRPRPRPTNDELLHPE